MRFRIWHILLFTLVVGVALKAVSYVGTEYLEFEVLEIVDEGETYSVMWHFRNCPLADDLQPRTFVALQFESDGNFEKIKHKQGDVVKMRYRVQALGPYEVEDPRVAVLVKLRLDHLNLVIPEE